MAAVTLFAVTASAQQLRSPKTAADVQVASVKDMKFDNKTTVLNKHERATVSSNVFETNVPVVQRTSKRTVDNGLWYKRPKGTYLITSTQSSSSQYTYMIVPPFIDLTYTNMATDKSATTWTIGTRTLDADENGDLIHSFIIPSAGYVNYNPVLNSNNDSFNWGESVTPNNYNLPVDTVYSVTQLSRAGGFWSGFSNGYVFGTNESSYMDGEEEKPCYCSYITEFFDKPASPFYLTDIFFYFISDSQRAIPEGTDMTLKILKVDEEGAVTDEELATMTFNMNDTLWVNSDADGSYGVIMASVKETDVFGSVIETPVVISDEFAVRIEGFNQPGVDFSLFMADVRACAENNWEQAKDVFPTIYTYVNADGEVVGSRYQYIDSETAKARGTQPRQYNAVMFLDGMFDVAKVDEGFDNMLADPEGGPIYALFDEYNEETNETETHAYGFLQYQTTLPRLSTWMGEEGNENYYFVDMPSWLSVTGHNDSYYAEYGQYTLTEITAEPLPAGTNSRVAQIRIVSDKGAESGVITVTQSGGSGIASLKSDKDVKSVSYNLSGQRVNNNFKGLVVKDGRKFMRK